MVVMTVMMVVMVAVAEDHLSRRSNEKDAVEVMSFDDRGMI